jgi:hypothetical protein
MRFQPQRKAVSQRNISLYDNVAFNCPSKAFELISQYGNYPKPKSPQQLSSYLKQFALQGGEPALLKIAEIHPDRELILATHKCEECLVKDTEASALKDKLHQTTEELKSEKQMAMFSNMTGQNNQNSVKVPSADASANYNNMQLLVATAFILLGIAYFTKK